MKRKISFPRIGNYDVPFRYFISRVFDAETVAPLVHHKPVYIQRNYFADHKYFEDLAHEREINNVAGKYRAVWERQDGKCFLRGSPILPDQLKEIAPIDALRDCAGGNMAYVHSRCTQSDVDFYKTTEYFARSSDVLHMLERLSNRDVLTQNDYRFEKLKEYLWEQTKPTITLTFAKIEEIIGFKLAKRSDDLLWWQKRWSNGISSAGHDTGYVLKRVDFKARRVTFTRDENAASTVKIPEIFLKGKVPADAVTELMAFIEYLREKYGF